MPVVERTARNLFGLELEFTETYRQYMESDPATREAACLKVLYPALFQPVRKGDLFAGRTEYKAVGVGLEIAAGGPGYYCHADALEGGVKDADAETRRRVREMVEFWKKESTIDGRLISMLSPDLLANTTNSVANMGGRLAGCVIDFEKLVKKGLPGLRAEIEKRSGPFPAAMLSALDTFDATIAAYAEETREAAAIERDPEWKIELLEMTKVLESNRVRAPESLREALQLSWLYALISGVVNYGRMDVYAGDFYARDVDSGRMTEAGALRLLKSLWKLIADRGVWFNGRVIVGGKGRPNAKNADRFALAAMEATRTVIETEPQLTLRFDRKQDPRLMEKALTVIGEGRTYPMLYNDDVNVPAVRKAFRVGMKAAEQYIPYGCGEYALDHMAFGSPNCSYNLLKALELALHNGVDPATGRQTGPKTGDFSRFRNFARLWHAYRKQAEFFARALATRHRIEYEAERESAAFLFVSILYDDCIKRGKSLVDGGARYRGGVIESFGLVNAGDALAAVRWAVYDRKLIAPKRLLAALKADFKGYEQERRILLDAPKYGNDDRYVDSLVRRVSDHACRYIISQARRIGFDYMLMVNINNLGNVQLGGNVGATPDGRRSGSPLANGNNPEAGADRKGVTAFLNSIVKLNPEVHAGFVQNMKFSRRMFNAERSKLEALLGTYFEKGGTQAMITVVDRGDLEAAMKEPEKYSHLIVRIGGYSHRFVELPREVQLDVANRSLY